MRNDYEHPIIQTQILQTCCRDRSGCRAYAFRGVGWPYPTARAFLKTPDLEIGPVKPREGQIRDKLHPSVDIPLSQAV
jgi:hypothetical protein